jgi:flagellar biosynthesis/type III secretory pathway protein FliH
MHEEETTIAPFHYPICPEPSMGHWEGMTEDLSPNQSRGDEPVTKSRTSIKDSEPSCLELAEQTAADASSAFDAGRRQGFEEGCNAEREKQDAQQAAANLQRTGQIAQCVESFAFDRDRYFNEVEREVVRLALAVAARILGREVQADPLLLTGAVRAALGQLSRSSQVRLRVPASDLELWTETIYHIPNLALRPTIVAAEEMESGDCRIEMEMGSVDLGIRAQLEEIKRSFFERCASGGLEREGPEGDIARTPRPSEALQ